MPFRDEIVNFDTESNYRGNALQTINEIKQQLGMGTVCFNCDGSKIQSMIDAKWWILNYETK